MKQADRIYLYLLSSALSYVAFTHMDKISWQDLASDRSIISTTARHTRTLGSFFFMSWLLAKVTP